MKNATKGKLIKAGAITLDVGAPLVVTLLMFPIWVDRSAESTVSGLFLLLTFLSCIPFAKWLKSYFKSPDAWVMWCVIFVALVALRRIIEEMQVVAAVGAISNVFGAVLYKIGDSVGSKEDKPKENDTDPVEEGSIDEQ